MNKKIEGYVLKNISLAYIVLCSESVCLKN